MLFIDSGPHALPKDWLERRREGRRQRQERIERAWKVTKIAVGLTLYVAGVLVTFAICGGAL